MKRSTYIRSKGFSNRAVRIFIYTSVALVALSLRGFREPCPTIQDVEGTFGTRSMAYKIWEDKTCTSGCLLKECVKGHVPCCVVRRSNGLVNAFRYICTRQVDNYLFSQQVRYGERSLIKYCSEYLSLKLFRPECATLRERKVPGVLHTIGPDDQIPIGAKLALQFSPDLIHLHVNDTQGYDVIAHKCSLEAAKAYACIKVPAFRADLYRFCILHAQGGIYMDMDIIPLMPVWDIVSPCSSFTLGYDQAQRVNDIDHIGMQMKILAAEPGNLISRCMLDHIIAHVKRRSVFTKDILSFSGPQLLRKCYLMNPHDVAVTYIDTRGADWPYAGLRANTTILAYERPSQNRHFQEISERVKEFEYADMTKHGDIFSKSCLL